MFERLRYLYHLWRARVNYESSRMYVHDYDGNYSKAAIRHAQEADRLAKGLHIESDEPQKIARWAALQHSFKRDAARERGRILTDLFEHPFLKSLSTE